MVKNPPATHEMQAQSLGQEDTLGKEVITHSSILPGKSERSLAGYSPWGHKESDMTSSKPQYTENVRKGSLLQHCSR